MATKKCPHCGTENSTDSAFCTTCGQSLNAPAAPAAPAYTPAPSAPYTPEERTITGFHRGYANTLKVVTYIFTIGFPLITFLALCFASEGDGGVMVASLFACGIMAFVLWLTWSFTAKLFDLVSKIAMLNAQLVQEVRELKKKN